MQKDKLLYGLIANGNAGKVKAGGYKKDEFEELFNGEGIIKETQSLDELKDVLKKFKDLDIQVLFTFGGDGTHQKIYSAMIEMGINFPVIVPLKGGTMNMFVKDVYLGAKGINVAKRVLALYKHYEKDIPTFPKPILKITKDDDNPVYGFYFANGVIYKVLKKYYEEPSSVKNAVRVTIGSLLGSFFPSHSYSKLLKRVKCRIFIDGKEYKYGRFLGIMLSTMSRVVFGMTPFIEISKSKNTFHFMAYSFRRTDLIWNFLRLARGVNVNNPKVHTFTCKSVKLEYDSGFVLDGEVYEIDKPSVIQIEVGDYLKIPILKTPV